MARIRVTVTQEDIDNGKQNNTMACPVALALRRVKGFERAAVASRIWAPAQPCGRSYCYVYRHYPVPIRVTSFITAFDHYGAAAVKPSTFYLSTR